jgi:hypothetical protein
MWLHGGAPRWCAPSGRPRMAAASLRGPGQPTVLNGTLLSHAACCSTGLLRMRNMKNIMRFQRHVRSGAREALRSAGGAAPGPPDGAACGRAGGRDQPTNRPRRLTHVRGIAYLLKKLIEGICNMVCIPACTWAHFALGRMHGYGARKTTAHSTTAPYRHHNTPCPAPHTAPRPLPLLAPCSPHTRA